MIPIPFCLGYAETHYRFLPGLSLIHRRVPEILTDAPARIEPGQGLPLAIVVKDAHLYPIVLERVEITAYQENAGCIWKRTMPGSPGEINAPLFWTLFEIPLPRSAGSLIMFNTRIEFKARGQRHTVLNHNLPTLPPSQLVVRRADQHLPCEPGWYYGDAHVHTNYSTSHVEFGAPLSLTAKMAKAFGLSWFAAADHSYDFMCLRDDFRRFGPGDESWKQRNQELQEVTDGVTILPAEEISCGNAENQNVHLLAMGLRRFISGSGDGARRKWNRRAEHPVGEAIVQVRAQGGLCYAAHPLAKAGWLQNLALNRGAWTKKDLSENLDGIQLWSGQRDSAFYRMRKEWVNLLLSGKRLHLVAGTDAHGDFNCTRKIKTPFLSLEQNETSFGLARTCVEAESSSAIDIMTALGKGRSIITDGPFGRIQVEGNRLCWRALSTSEFGRLRRLRIFSGCIGESAEQIVGEREWKDQQPCYEARGETPSPKAAYVRAELTSRVGEREFLCMTNPLWL